MTLSEMFYEAACRTSDVTPEDYPASDYEFSCCAVAVVETGSPEHYSSPAAVRYASLMGGAEEFVCASEVYTTAKEAGWSEQDYRIFMLLMASEAVK